MAKKFVIVESLELSNTKSLKFIQSNDGPYSIRESELSYKLVSFEIKSSAPPTHCDLTISYYQLSDNTVKYISINFINYIKEFVFENNLYIIYFDLIKEITNDILPLELKFTNKRDLNSKATLIYQSIFTGR